MSSYSIGEVAARLDLSVDTLRYYEKIGLIPRVNRSRSGVRRYDEKDISRLQFIKRAQKMNFTLAEIADLLRMRDNPHDAQADVRRLTAAKLEAVQERLAELETLRGELQLLLNLCQSRDNECPILDEIDGRR